MQSKYAAKHERHVLEEYELTPSHKDKLLAKELVKRVAASYRQCKEWKEAGFDRFRLDSQTHFEFSEDGLSVLVWRTCEEQNDDLLKVVPRYCMIYGTPEEMLGVAYVLAAQPWTYL